MTKKQQTRGALIALAALGAVICLFAAIWLSTRPDIMIGDKTLTIQVIHSDGSEKFFALRTDAVYLGDALLEHEALGIKGEQKSFGLYITEVDGETASDSDRTYWAITMEGEELLVGADEQVIADGQRYALVLTKW